MNLEKQELLTVEIVVFDDVEVLDARQPISEADAASRHRAESGFPLSLSSGKSYRFRYNLAKGFAYVKAAYKR
jgi:hypothetical protein